MKLTLRTLLVLVSVVILMGNQMISVVIAQAELIEQSPIESVSFMPTQSDYGIQAIDTDIEPCCEIIERCEMHCHLQLLVQPPTKDYFSLLLPSHSAIDCAKTHYRLAYIPPLIRPPIA